MKKLLLIAGVVLLSSICFAQYSLSLYAGGQISSSHQKIVLHQSPSFIIVRHFLPDFGFSAGLSLSRPLSPVFSISNQTGYSQINLLHDDLNKDRFSMHFLITEFAAQLYPFTSDKFFWGGISLFVGPGLRISLNHDELSKSIMNGNPWGPYMKAGINLKVSRLCFGPFLEIPLSSFNQSRLGEVFHYDLYLRNFGLRVGYKLL
ncbi:MAG: hypothetical protein ACK4VN_00840 [Bacteroidales bacterium]